MSIRKRLLLITAAAVLVLVLLWAFRPQPERVETATVAPGPLLVTIDAEGIAQVEERYVVAAPVSGFAQRVTHEVGDAVQAGEVLAVLEPVPTTPLDARTQAELRARVQAAEAAMRSAEAQAAAARSQATLAAATRDRMRPLAADSILAAVELDRYEAEARQAADAQAAAEAAVEATRQELRAVRALLQSSAGARGGGAVAVRAPAGGAVLAVHHESEGVVAAGQPLVEVGDPSALEVVADVLSEEATRLAPAMRALVEAGGQTAEGRVREVEPVAFTDVSALGVEEQRVFVHVDLTEAAQAETPLRLGHGYRVRVRFVEWEDDDALRVPMSALFEQDGGWAVFAVEEGRARVTPVEVGYRAGLWAEVAAGLDAGALVVTHPSDDLADGLRVETD
ncbi:MAG: efflux RND transporter periplasmic adaptor subunit [Bacteroidota bacterium]